MLVKYKMEELFDYNGPRHPPDDGGVVDCPSGKPRKGRGRPRGTAYAQAFDIRLTPHDGKEIDFNQEVCNDFKRFLVAKEYGDQNNKLHYHAYLLTNISESTLRKSCAILAGGTGNAHFSTRIAHNGTQGYVVKEEDIVCRKGFTDEEIKEIVDRSREYRTKLETTRRGAQRAKEKFLNQVLREVASDIEEGRLASPTPFTVMKAILNIYHSKQIRFPARSTLECAVLSMLYARPEYEKYVVHFYSKNISNEEYNY